MISLSEIFVAVLLAAGLVYWWKAQGLKEVALRATRQHCSKLDLQLLDETLVLSKVKFGRDQRGLPTLGRLYRFEFTATGQDRNYGQTSLVGGKVVDIRLDAYRINH